MTVDLADAVARLTDGEELQPEDVQALTGSRDLIALGMLAEAVRRRRHGRRVTFLRVVEIGDTVPLADLPVRPEVGAWRLVGTGAADALVRFTERAVTAARGTPVSGFSLAALEECAHREARPLADLLAALQDAGLERVGEAPLDALGSPREAFAATRAAGLSIERLTLDRVVDDWPALVALLSSLGADAGLPCRFAPLPRSVESPATGYDDVRQVALARILLPVDSIQVDWAHHGPKLAQVALTFGADDIDAVVPFDTSATARRRRPLAELRRNIEAAALEPVERNGRSEPMT